jgi:Flp pilus assembly pilin Flp
MMDIHELKNWLRSFVADEEGLSATEYAILFVVLVAVIIAGATALGSGITNLFGAARDALP